MRRPFFNGRSTGAADGMEKSYQELLRLLKLMDKSPRVLPFAAPTGLWPSMRTQSTAPPCAI